MSFPAFNHKYHFTITTEKTANKKRVEKQFPSFGRKYP